MSKLQYHSGSEDKMEQEEFLKEVVPFLKDLERVGRTNFLCVFKYGNGDKTDVTGYSTSTTLNVTNNSRIIKSETTGGKWAVYQLVDN